MSSADSGDQLVTLRTERPFQGRIAAVRVDTVRLPGGRVAVREVVEHRPAAGVVALGADGALTLVRHYRHPPGQVLLELPAGIMEPGEDAVACARRELLEETGLEAGSVEHLGGCYPSPGISTEFIHLVLATELRPGRSPRDRDADEEILQLVRLPLPDAVELAISGRIADAKTVLGLLLADRRLRR